MHVAAHRSNQRPLHSAHSNMCPCEKDVGTRLYFIQFEPFKYRTLICRIERRACAYVLSRAARAIGLVALVSNREHQRNRTGRRRQVDNDVFG